MRSRRGKAVAGALALFGSALAAAGCGLGPGEDSGSAELRVTRDYGQTSVVDAGERELSGSETVLRMLDRSADVATRYSGRFVQSIEGLEGGTRRGHRQDWFFYVNGVESPSGAADVVPGDGDRVWWDYRDWSSAMRVPAVVGSFPAPFLRGFGGDAYATRIDCLGARPPCEAVQTALRAAGVKAGLFEAEHSPGFDAESAPTLRVLVGPWSRVGADPAAQLVERGPGQSGVFADFEGTSPGRLEALDERGRVALGFGPEAGLIAAVRLRDAPPTWLVTGGGPAGVQAASQAFGEQQLRDRYALVARTGAAPLALPVGAAGQ